MKSRPFSLNELSDKIDEEDEIIQGNKTYNKQLQDEAEYDIKNYADRGGCYPPNPEVKVDHEHPPRSA